MIGLVPRYECDGCGTVVDGPVSWRHGATPPTTQPGAFPAGWAMRWVNEHAKGGPIGYAVWCPECCSRLDVAGYTVANDARAQVIRERWAVGHRASEAAMAALPPEPPPIHDPLMANWRAK